MVICITKCLLDKKQQLSKIWLAAHWEKKIKRAQVFEVNIERSVQDILKTEIILDLRISGHLLVGIVKIHSRKTKYLLTECSNIFYQVKVFRTGPIDLPNDKQTAPVNDITLAEFFDNFNGIENNITDSLLTTNQCPIDQITLKETTGKLTLLDDDDMKEFEFHEEDEAIMFDDFPLDLGNAMSVLNNVDIPVNLNKTDDGAKKTDNNNEAKLRRLIIDDECRSEILNAEDIINEIPESIEMPDLSNKENDPPVLDNLKSSIIDKKKTDSDKLCLESVKRVKTIHTNHNKKSKTRKLRIDYITAKSYDVIKKQVLDTSDITLSVLDSTPATKRLMVLKEIGNAEQLLQLPSHPLRNQKLLKLYQRNLKTQKCEGNFDSDGEKESSENFHVSKKKSKEEIDKDYILDKNILNNVDSPVASNMRDNPKANIENYIPDQDDICMFDADNENILDQEETDQCVPEKNELNDNEVPLKHSNDIQSTQTSKTSEEKRDYALQRKIIQMLLYLKVLFEEKTVISFSSITLNKRKSWVAQQFLCLLMLKKFQVINLEQSKSFGEIFITPETTFEGACSKFCNF